MEEVQAQARLVDLSVASFAARGLMTTVPRAEIEEVIQYGEYPARLELDIARIGDGDVTVHSRVAVGWDEATLEKLLHTTSEDDVVLWFDPDELNRALQEAEVDAHGLRERAAIFAVAVAAAGATAGGALAVPTTSGGGAGVSTAAVSFVSDVASGIGQPAAAPEAAPASFVSDVASGIGQPAAAPETAPASFVSDVASGGIGQAEGDAIARYVTNVGIGDTSVPAAATPSFVSDVASGGTGGTTASPAAGGGSSVLSPAEETAIAAGVALLIAAASFTLTRSRTRPPRPA
jgi:hypothetical protein